MMLTSTDFKSSNEPLYAKIQEAYDNYFHPGTQYTCHLEYENVTKYGFIEFERREYHQTRVYNADEFIAWTMIQAPHLTLREADKMKFVASIQNAIMNFGNQITLHDTVVLYSTKKP